MEELNRLLEGYRESIEEMDGTLSSPETMGNLDVIGEDMEKVITEKKQAILDLVGRIKGS